MEEDQVSQSDDSQFNILSVSVTFRQHTTGDEHQEEGEEVTVDIINNNNNNDDDDDSNISRTAIEQDECCPPNPPVTPNPPAISTDKCCVGTKSGGEKEEGSTKETEVLKVCKLHGLSLITR